MQVPKRYQPRLIGLALGVFLALLIWPATGWLVRSQLSLTVPVTASVAPWSYNIGGTQPVGWNYAQGRYREITASQPDDFQMQFANAVAIPPVDGPLTSEIKIRRLREMTLHFPNRPTLYASLLRFATQEQVMVERAEISWLTGAPPSDHHLEARKSYNMPEQLAAFDRDAAEGERLDPDNAYFPLMRSVGLFAAHRDADALAAMQRAAYKPNWVEYCGDELDAEWKLHQAAFGTVSALTRTGYAYMILFPHYKELRNASRVAIALAVKAEQAGHKEEGLALRETVSQCGSLLRVQSPSAIGSMIGIAINQLAMTRPGGVPLRQDSSGVSTISLREKRVREYDAYLRSIGHGEKIAAADAEADAGAKARAIMKISSASPLDIAPSRLTLSWVADVALLSSALWILLLGGIAAFIARHRLIRSGQGLPAALQSGIGLGLFAGVLLTGIGFLGISCQASALCLSGILLSGGLAVALPGAAGADRRRRVGAFALSLVGTALFCSAFAWQSVGSVTPLVQLMAIYDTTEASAGTHLLAYTIFAIGATVALPVGAMLLFGILSIAWRVPLSVGMARCFRGCAVPIACSLLLAYGILVPLTLRQETALEEGLQRTTQHEGRYRAEVAGKPWPGPTH